MTARMKDKESQLLRRRFSLTMLGTEKKEKSIQEEAVLKGSKWKKRQ